MAFWNRSSKRDAAQAPKKPGWFGQLRASYRMASRVDRRLGLWTFGSAALAALVVGLLAWLVGPWWFWVLVGLPVVLLVGLVIFGRRAERAAFTQLEGQPGAAISAMSLIRRGWSTEPAVAVNRQQDVVHRALGRPGIVLIGEGNPGRVRQLIAQERRSLSRIVGQAPIHEVVIGNDEGQVPLRKLANHVRRLPKTLSNAEVAELGRRLRAMPTITKAPPIPKGPLPKNARMPRGGVPR
jgi:hypothetical protein